MALLNLGEMVAEQVKKTPGAVAVIYDGDEKNVCVKITYREMCQRGSQVSCLTFSLKHTNIFSAFHASFLKFYDASDSDCYSRALCLPLPLPPI